MEKFKTKHLVIDAVQWDGSEDGAIEISSQEDFAGVLDFKSGGFDGFYINNSGVLIPVFKNDYIIRSTEGEYYASKPDIFEKTYEPVIDFDASINHQIKNNDIYIVFKEDEQKEIRLNPITGLFKHYDKVTGENFVIGENLE